MLDPLKFGVEADHQDYGQGVFFSPDAIEGFAEAVRADMQREVEWEYGWAADLPDGRLWTGDHDPRHQYSWGISFLDWDKNRSASVLPTVRQVRRQIAGPWLPVTPSTPNQTGAEHG